MRFRLFLSIILGVGLLTACVDSGSGSSLPNPPSEDSRDIPGSPTTTDWILSDDLVSRITYQAATNEINEFWSSYLSSLGISGYQTPTQTYIGVFDTVTCGSGNESITYTAEVNEGPVYCIPQAEMIMPLAMTNAYLETPLIDFTDEMGNTQKVAVGPIGLYFLIAHELGHHILMTVIAPQIDEALLSQVTLVDIENHADCLSGIAIAGVPTMFEIKEAQILVKFAELIGEPFGGSHGTPEERMDAVVLGIEAGYDPDFSDGYQSDGFLACTARYLPTLVEDPVTGPTNAQIGEVGLDEYNCEVIFDGYNWLPLQMVPNDSFCYKQIGETIFDAYLRSELTNAGWDYNLAGPVMQRELLREDGNIMSDIITVRFYHQDVNMPWMRSPLGSGYIEVRDVDEFRWLPLDSYVQQLEQEVARLEGQNSEEALRRREAAMRQLADVHESIYRMATLFIDSSE